MAQELQHWQVVTDLAGDELGTVLGSLGDYGDQSSRLQAVVALFAGVDGDAAARGAFADSPSNVTAPFTSGFHNCLRERAVNAASSAITRSALGKQC